MIFRKIPLYASTLSCAFATALSFAQAPPPVTLAWQKTMTGRFGIGNVSIDKEGNIWSLARFTTNNGSYWLVYERDSYGDLINDLTIPIDPHLNVQQSTLAADSSGNVYILSDVIRGTTPSTEYNQSVLTAFDSRGAQKWSYDFPASHGHDNYRLSLLLDQTNNLYAFSLSFPGSYERSTSLVKASSSGQLLINRQYPEAFAGPNYDGSNDTVAFDANGDLWLSASAIGPDHNAALVKLDHVSGDITYSEPTNNTNPNDYPVILFQLNPDGTYYKLVQVYSNSYESYVLSYLNAAHAVQWQTTFGGVAYVLSATDVDHVYLSTALSGGDPQHMNLLRIDKGQLVWHSSPLGPALSNPLDKGVFVPSSPSGIDTLGELDQNGHWLYSSGMARHDTELHYLNGSVITYGIDDKNSSSTVTLSRFVQGPALSSLGAPASVQAGQSYTLTLTLSAPAPSGGLLENLTLTGPGTFAHNGQKTLSVAIPTGSTKANVTITAGPSSTPSAIAVVAKGQFVVRSASTAVQAKS